MSCGNKKFSKIVSSQLLSSLLSNVKSFEAKLELWNVQLEQNTAVHFPTLIAWENLLQHLNIKMHVQI